MESKQSGTTQPEQGDSSFDDLIDLQEIFRRLGRGVGQVIGFASLGLALAVVATLVSLQLGSPALRTRLAFSFEGLEKGHYPDESKFQVDDLRAPDVILTAVRRLNLEGSGLNPATVRSSLSIEAIIPDETVKQRDKMRTAGQIPPPYTPDEYSVLFTLPKSIALLPAQKAQLLEEIVMAYRDKFVRTYGEVPVNFGNVFESLRGADFFDYEFIIKQDLRSITDYLTEQKLVDQSFRAPTTNLSFGDLLDQVQKFAVVRASSVLGSIRASGLTEDRQLALIKVDYSLREVGSRIETAIAREKVVRDLLATAQARDQSYVLGVKSQATEPRSDRAVLDQGLVDSLLANDAFSFLVRKALTAGLEVKDLESERAQLLEQRQALVAITDGPMKQGTVVESVKKSLTLLEAEYKKLVESIRKTREDYSRQKFSDVVRITAGISTQSTLRKLALYGIAGAAVGTAFGVGLSLLGFVVGRRRI